MASSIIPAVVSFPLDVLNSMKTAGKTILTIILFFFCIALWIFVFKATDGFTIVSSDWICIGALALTISVPSLIGALVYIHTRE